MREGFFVCVVKENPSTPCGYFNPTIVRAGGIALWKGEKKRLAFTLLSERRCEVGGPKIFAFMS